MTSAPSWKAERGVTVPKETRLTVLFQQKVLRTKQQAGEIVQVHPKSIERHIRAGKLRAYKLGGRIRIRRDDLDAWIESNVVDPSPHDI